MARQYHAGKGRTIAKQRFQRRAAMANEERRAMDEDAALCEKSHAGIIIASHKQVLFFMHIHSSITMLQKLQRPMARL